MMGYGPWLKAPVSLEVIGTGVDFAPAKVEKFASSLRCATHHMPVHKIVCPKGSSFGSASRVIRHHTIAEIEIQDATDRLPFKSHRQDFTGLTKFLLEPIEIPSGKDRRAEVADAQRVKRVQVLGDRDRPSRSASQLRELCAKRRAVYTGSAAIADRHLAQSHPERRRIDRSVWTTQSYPAQCHDIQRIVPT